MEADHVLATNNVVALAKTCCKNNEEHTMIGRANWKECNGTGSSAKFHLEDVSGYDVTVSPDSRNMH